MHTRALFLPQGELRARMARQTGAEVPPPDTTPATATQCVVNKNNNSAKKWAPKSGGGAKVFVWWS